MIKVVIPVDLMVNYTGIGEWNCLSDESGSN